MLISHIVAVSENGIIGKNNQLPWHLPNDLEWFKKKTMGHCVIMGRRNYESEGKALPNRTNLVISQNPNFTIPDGIVARSIEDALIMAEKQHEQEVFIIGGGQIYEISLPYIQKIYLTRIHANIDGDVYYPEPDWNEWELIYEQFNLKDARHAYDYTFYIYERLNKI
ncbi:MAG: dihydrofolate reductase [Bacteroidales bacterium]|nr:dihydrofolate reductase [Bacteroidales bacterium]